jgi:hypothetical protein
MTLRVASGALLGCIARATRPEQRATRNAQPTRYFTNASTYAANAFPSSPAFTSAPFTM